ncbi:hypothetical protein, conserved [Eimeria praecox]|uniref:Protein kinase domain-containing protein n=1 Tax=Eimeria praecox TaxID=51316 RepID=U6GZ88_9EIME|nr:hypothetical protein, conserved [Eimeria praecox]
MKADYLERITVGAPEVFAGSDEANGVAARGIHSNVAATANEGMPLRKHNNLSPWWVVLGFLFVCGSLGLLRYSTTERRVGDNEQRSLLPEGLGGTQEHPFPQATPSDDPQREQKLLQMSVSSASQAVSEGSGLTSVNLNEPSASLQMTPRRLVDLPNLDDASLKLPFNLERAKSALFLAGELAGFAARSGGGKAVGEKEKRMMEAVADALSQGGTRELVGISFVLASTARVSPLTPPRYSSWPLTVDRILGIGPFSVYVTAKDLSYKTWTVRLLAFETKECQRSPNDCWDAFLRGAEAIASTCGDEEVAAAAARRGLLIPVYTGMVEGLSFEGVHAGHIVLKEVEVMKELLGNLEDALPFLSRHTSNSRDARFYVAHQVLVQTLHLQKAGMSHNGLEWRNLFVDHSGSVLLGGMESATRFGEAVPLTAGLNRKFAEPQLFREFEMFKQGGPPVRAHEKSDMWSLGILLYEVLTGRPFEDLALPGSPFDEISRNVAQLELRSSNVPSDWRELILLLLVNDRARRISASEVSERFGSLL